MSTNGSTGCSPGLAPSSLTPLEVEISPAATGTVDSHSTGLDGLPRSCRSADSASLSVSAVAPSARSLFHSILSAVPRVSASLWHNSSHRTWKVVSISTSAMKISGNDSISLTFTLREGTALARGSDHWESALRSFDVDIIARRVSHSIEELWRSMNVND